MSVEDVIAERASTHGDYTEQAKGAQALKSIIQSMPNYKNMPPHMKESLDLIATKISRLGHGDFNHMDSWLDIAGYAHLITKSIPPKHHL